MARRLKKKFSTQIEQLLFKIKEDKSISKNEKFEVSLELENLRNTISLKSKAKSDRERAQIMAENAVYIQSNYNSSMLLSAHNGHVIKGAKDREMGYYINDFIGDKFYSLGTEFLSGSITTFSVEEDSYIHKVENISPSEKGAFSSYLSEISKSNFIIDFERKEQHDTKILNKKWDLTDILGCYGMDGCNKRYWLRNPMKSYDGILFVYKTTESSIFWVKRPIKGYDFEYPK